MICSHCNHKMGKEQNLSGYTVVGIQYIMHTCCAVEVKKNAIKKLASLSEISKIRSNYYAQTVAKVVPHTSMICDLVHLGLTPRGRMEAKT